MTTSLEALQRDQQAQWAPTDLMPSDAISIFIPPYDLNKLYCETASFNLPSVRLLESLGFTRDGVLRQHHERDGKLHDTYHYSLVKSEWRTLSNR